MLVRTIHNLEYIRNVKKEYINEKIIFPLIIWDCVVCIYYVFIKLIFKQMNIRKKEDLRKVFLKAEAEDAKIGEGLDFTQLHHSIN